MANAHRTCSKNVLRVMLKDGGRVQVLEMHRYLDPKCFVIKNKLIILKFQNVLIYEKLFHVMLLFPDIV